MTIMRAAPCSVHYREALLTLLGALALTGGALLPPSPVRALLVVPLALILPGSAMLWALLGPASACERPARLALSCVLSLAHYPLLALVLSFCGFRLTTPHILAGVDLEHALLAAIILARAARYASRAPDDPNAFSLVAGPASTHRRLSKRPLVPRRYLPALGLLPLLVGAYAVVESAPPLPFNQLALAGTWARLAGSVTPSSPVLQVPVVVGNHSGGRRTYRLTADIDGRSRRPARLLTLSAGAGWTGQIAVAAPDDACLHRLRVLLTDGTGGTRTMLTLWAHGRAYGTRRCVSVDGSPLVPGDSRNPPPTSLPVVALALRPATLDGPRGGIVPAHRDDPPRRPHAPTGRNPTGRDAAVPPRPDAAGA